MPTSIISPEVQTAFEQARLLQIRRVNAGDQTVDLPAPFSSPEDWRDQWIYFLLIDRFNNPQAPPRFAPFDGAHEIFQGGTFNGVREKLAYLKRLGVGAIWLSPVLKNCQYKPDSYHGYGIQDFLQIDPRFASDPKLAEEELRALIDEAHARGMYVIFDIVLNHAGDVFEYVFDNGGRDAEANGRDKPYKINWRDETGRGNPAWEQPPDNPHPDAVVWPVELQRNEFFRRQGKGGEAGGDFFSLKEMVTDFHSPDYPVRNVLIRAYQYLIAKYDADGFRIDTLKFIEPEFAKVFGNAMREFALSIGKKNFFTFGEVYDNEEKIAHFIGRQASEPGDLTGVDAALDFPLFYKLPAMAKGMIAPAEIVNVFEHRKQVQRGLISSHGEASRFFVTFLDNHDQTQRFFFSPADEPMRFADQLTLGITCLFTLQGIPCLYYGTEQGLHGFGGDKEVREALWGKAEAFNQEQPIFKTIERLSTVRSEQPALRYGRQYFRQISGDGKRFGISTFAPGVLAFSRVLNDQELLIVANTSTQSDWNGAVIVDRTLNQVGATYEILFTNKTSDSSDAPGVVIEKAAGQVEVHELDGAVTHGPVRAVHLRLRKMEIQILRQKKSG